MMTSEEAYRKLPEYLDGGLLPHERDEMERLFGKSPELKEALRLSLMIEASLRHQPWLQASPKFAQEVAKRAAAELPPRVTAWDQTWERVRASLSLGTAALILIVANHPIREWGTELLGGAGQWLGGVTGLSVFALHPVILLGLIAPVLAGGLAGCVLSGRCRFASD